MVALPVVLKFNTTTALRKVKVVAKPQLKFTSTVRN
jgi:hypothetical protein